MEEIPIAREISECRIIIDDPVVDPVIEAIVNPVVNPVEPVVRVVEHSAQYTHTREIISFIICAAIVMAFFILIMLAFTN